MLLNNPVKKDYGCTADPPLLQTNVSLIGQCFQILTERKNHDHGKLRCWRLLLVHVPIRFYFSLFSYTIRIGVENDSKKWEEWLTIFKSSDFAEPPDPGYFRVEIRSVGSSGYRKMFGADEYPNLQKSMFRNVTGRQGRVQRRRSSPKVL